MVTIGMSLKTDVKEGTVLNFNLTLVDDSGFFDDDIQQMFYVSIGKSQIWRSSVDSGFLIKSAKHRRFSSKSNIHTVHKYPILSFIYFFMHSQ